MPVFWHCLLWLYSCLNSIVSYMIVTSTFVGQVMKFEDLKELGSESAVKVYAPTPWTFLLSACLSFDLNSECAYCRLLENTSRRGKPMWFRTGTSSFSNSTCLVAGRSEKCMKMIASIVYYILPPNFSFNSVLHLAPYFYIFEVASQ